MIAELSFEWKRVWDKYLGRARFSERGPCLQYHGRIDPRTVGEEKWFLLLPLEGGDSGVEKFLAFEAIAGR